MGCGGEQHCHGAVAAPPPNLLRPPTMMWCTAAPILPAQLAAAHSTAPTADSDLPQLLVAAAAAGGCRHVLHCLCRAGTIEGVRLDRGDQRDRVAARHIDDKRRRRRNGRRLVYSARLAVRPPAPRRRQQRRGLAERRGTSVPGEHTNKSKIAER